MSQTRRTLSATRAALLASTMFASTMLLLASGCGGERAASNQVGIAPTTSAATVMTEVIYVPAEDKLKRRRVSSKSLESQIRAGGNAAPALQEIIQGAPKYFPAKTKVNNFKNEPKHIEVDMNTNFADQDFWGVKGTSTTELAIYSLVNSASGASKKPVLLTVEGKPMPNIGEFDMSDALPPRADLVAPQ